jgi:hypothetical protein
MVRATCASRARRADNHQPNRCHHQDLGHLRLQVRPVAIPWRQPLPRAEPDGARILRILEEVGSAVASDQVRTVRYRIVRDFRQHLSPLPAGYQLSCIHREFITRAQAPMLRVRWPRDARADHGASRRTT